MQIVSQVLRESLRIRTLEEIVTQDIRPKFKPAELGINLIPGEASIDTYVNMQKSYEKISHLKNFLAVVEILKGNQLEHKDRKIFKDFSVL